MKTLKIFTYVFFIISITLASCSTDDGEDGIDGQDGAIGLTGADGEDGTDGINGTDGEDGQDGTNGTDGEDGTNGTDGEDGQDGTNGTDGEDGEDGEDGNADVYSSEWIGANFDTSATDLTTFTVVDPIFTQDVVDSAAILAYARTSGGVLAIPIVLGTRSYYYGARANATTSEIIFVGATTDGSTQIFGDFIDVRYVIIPQTGRSSQQSPEATKAYYESQGLDLNDYDAVMEYFNLEK